MQGGASPYDRSSRRPVPLIGRPDLVVSTVVFRGVQHHVVKDPVGLKYHRLSGEQFRLLCSLDGKQTLESLRALLIKEFPTNHLNLRELQQLAADLHKNGLAYSLRTGQAETRGKQFREHRWQQIRQTWFNLLSLRLPGWDPDQFLRKLLPFVSWMFQPWGVAICLTIVIASWIQLGLRWQEYRHSLPGFQQFFGWPNLIYLWITLAFAKILHEFGHGLSCRYFGSECHEMGVMLLVFSPCLYCDVTDSWMLPNKWQRIIIGGAGMYVEAILSALAIFVWQATSTGFLHYLSLNLFFVTAVTTIIFNANPLMRLDGYYMLSDWLEIPNLRPQADRFLKESFGHWVLGIEPTTDPFAPQSGRIWFVVFAIASYVYSWIVLGGILLFLYSVLKPHGLQIAGQAAAVMSVCGILGGGATNFYRLLTAPRSKSLSRWRIGLATTGLLSTLILLFLIPIPWYRTSACLIEPRDVHHVYSKTPGQIEEVLVRPGDYVQTGTVLVRMADPVMEDRLRDLQIRIGVQNAVIEGYEALDDPAHRAIAMETREGLRREETEIQEYLSQLNVVASCSGKVVASPRQPASTLDQLEMKLPTWEGNPLDERNRGAFLAEHTHLLSLSPTDSPDAPVVYQGVVFLDQSDLFDIHEGLTLRMKLDSSTWMTSSGRIREIGLSETAVAPPELTVKQGGSLTTTTDKSGREKLTDAAYQAIVDFDQTSVKMQNSLRGHVKVLVYKRSVGGWVWRWLRRTFNFRL